MENEELLELENEELDELSDQMEEDVESQNFIQLYFKEVSKTKLMSPDEVQECIKLIRAGGSQGAHAKKKLIGANQRLIIRIAKKYKFLPNNFIDRIQDGNIGLSEAIDRYDPEKGAFSSYVSPAIEHAITNGAREFIEMPKSIQTKILEYKRMEKKLMDQYMAQPTPEEVAAELKWKKETLNSVLEWMKGKDSLNRLISKDEGDKGGSELEAFVLDDSSEDTYKEYENATLWKLLDQLLSVNEKVAVEAHLGKESGERKTWETVAEEQGWKEARARFFGVMGMRKLEGEKNKF